MDITRDAPLPEGLPILSGDVVAQLREHYEVAITGSFHTIQDEFYKERMIFQAGIMCVIEDLESLLK